MTGKIQIQIYQVVENKKRISSHLFKKLEKLYRIKLNRISLDELKDITDNKVHLLIFDSLNINDIKYTDIDPIQNNNKHLYTMVVSDDIQQESAAFLYDKHIDYLCNSTFDDYYILALMKTILKRKSNKYFRETEEQYKNIKIDSILREVYVSGKLIETSNKEFRLIRFLVRNNEEFTPKQVVFSKVWGYDEDTSRILDQYIHKIKKKIGEEVIIIKDKNKGMKLL